MNNDLLPVPTIKSEETKDFACRRNKGYKIGFEQGLLHWCWTTKTDGNLMEYHRMKKRNENCPHQLKENERI